MIFQWTDVGAVVRPKKSLYPSEAMEFQVDPAWGPFLIMGATGFIWVDGGRRSVRTLGTAFTDSVDLERRILKEIRARSLSSKWGAIFENSPEGVQAAKGRLDLYGYHAQKAFVGQGPHILGEGAEVHLGIESGEALFTSSVPEEAGWVGVASGLAFVVVHDPSRAFSFLV